MTGDAFSFMALCANIITELKTLSAASRQAQQQAIYLAQQQQRSPEERSIVCGYSGRSALVS